MNKKTVDVYQTMYQTFMQNRTAPVGREYELIPSRRGGVTLAALKDRIDGLSGEEFVITLDIGGRDHV